MVDIIGPKSYTDRYKQVKELTGRQLERLGEEDVREEFLSRRVRGEGKDDVDSAPETEISDAEEFDEAKTLMDQAESMVMNYRQEDQDSEDYKEIIEIPKDDSAYTEAVELRFNAARDKALEAQKNSKEDKLPKEFQSESGATIQFDEWLDNIESAKVEAKEKLKDEQRYAEDDDEKEVSGKPKRPRVKLPKTRTIDEERQRGENLLDPSILRPESEEEE